MILEKTDYKEIFQGMGTFTYFFDMNVVLKWGIYSNLGKTGHVQLFRTKKERDKNFRPKKNMKSRRFKLFKPIVILEIERKKIPFYVS